MKKILSIIAILLGTALVALIVFGVGVYGFSWRGAFARSVLRILPYPAAVANARIIAMNDFYEDQETIRYFYSQSQNPGQPDTADVDASLLNRLVFDSVLSFLAEKNKVTVSGADIEARLKEISDAQTGNESLDAILTRLYGWNTEQFKQKILVPFLQEEKLKEIVANDSAANEDARKRAEEVLADVQKGEKTFEALAQEFSEDSSASVGGDVGYFGRGEMVKPFEDAAFALQPGETSGIVESEFGFHIIRVEEKISDAEKGEQVRARHILIKRQTIDALIAEEMENASVRVFVPGFRWNSEKNWVEKNEG